MKLTPEEDKEFAAVLLKDIPYFHKLYAKYNDPQYLEIVRNLVKVYDHIKSKSPTGGEINN